ncbi:SagB/ThcOx family dehydrogenase [Methanofollis formosanus]|nr:SagB/ThcOx family dehydrogenase [Methanofollis formosanus]
MQRTMSRTGRTFLEETKFVYLAPSDQVLGRPQPPLERPHAGPVTSLPPPEDADLRPVDLVEAIARRRSVRTYAPEPLPLATLSYLLWCSQGVTSVYRDAWTFRTVPSAGARHALETYLLINQVEGLAPGLYHYAALSHGLSEIEAPEDAAEAVEEALISQPMVGNAAVVFLWAADISRMTWRYGERGYRYIFMDAGHACQNLYLGAEAVGCGVCAMAAFDDDALNALLGLDGERLFAIYAAAVGQKG